MRSAVVFLILLTGLRVLADSDSQPVETYRVRQNRALELAQSDSPEAEGALKALLQETPGDSKVLLRLAIYVSVHARLMEPGVDRRKRMLEAREFYVRAAKAGSDDPLIATSLAVINEDGSENDAAMATNAEVDRQLHQAEEAFGKQKYDSAIEHYQAALVIEPKNYYALLHLGDTYFVTKQHLEAIEWFKKAIAVAPDSETAYRYCGDALMHLGRKDEALESFLSAVIANPYNGYPWRGLQAGCAVMLLKPWVTASKAPFAKIKDDPVKPEILLPEKFNPFDLAYALARQTWIKDHRAQRFPPGTQYRQTLEEETAALVTVLKIHAELKQAKAPQEADTESYKQCSAALDELAEISSAGLLEAHVLFFRANADIATDYSAYRAKNRDKLRNYLLKYYLHLP